MKKNTMMETTTTTKVLREIMITIPSIMKANQQHNTTGKDIKKGMDKYEAKMKSGEAPTGDSTRSEE